MKNFTRVLFIVFLFLIGIVEIFYGAFLGRIGVGVQERYLASDLHPPDFTSDQARAFAQHFGELKVQWGVVTYFGIATIIIGIVLLMLERKKS